MKQTYHYLLRKFHHIKPAYLLMIAVVFACLAVYGLRQNNFKMIELRQAVISADESGEDVEKPLQELRAHVHRHMNTDLSSGNVAIKPPIQLKGRYERLMANEEGRIKQLNDQVALQAESLCAGQFPGEGFNAPRVDCIQRYVADNAVTSSEVAESLYKFDFVSPRWSWDLAGISLLLTVLFSFLFMVRVIVSRIK